MIRLDIEHTQHLIEHFTMLTRNGYHSLELIGMAFELVHERAHLDSLRAGAEDEHDLFHISRHLSYCPCAL